ncbi:tRNA (adenosine(37)-N6)-threonylcarbamoyltransferase complex dimerization subunit type 1 TsaB [Oleidesulfovibrio sp.]|uniref:tRNA (adenosine(37)-N6)-threonylcarbamoyltransferase complex dimerization subunit type 1 TsaB n=1 Tax=Oleidesulfovibrio sp. TaxID=2909707 RepID=UPI003A86EA03
MTTINSCPAPEADLTLVINAAEGRLQVVAGSVCPAQPGDTSLLFSFEMTVPRQGTEVLAPAIHDAMSRMRVSMKEIRRIAVINGPGGFTGLRLALATTLGLSRALAVPTAGISYTEALATDAAQVLAATGTTTESGKPVLWAILHARRDQVMVQGFTLQADGQTAPLQQVTTFSVSEASRHIVALTQGNNGHAYFFGSGLRRNMQAIKEAMTASTLPCTMLPSRFDHVRPETMLAMTTHAQWDHEPVEPEYVRGCDAEENLPRLAAARGMEPELAVKTLRKLTSS